MSASRRALVWGGAGLAVVLGVWWLVGGHSQPVRAPLVLKNEPAKGRTHTVALLEIDDGKTVFATVRSKDRVEARARIAGTVVELKTDEGRSVQAGEVLAVVTDQKIALRLGAIDAQISGARSRAETAQADLDRTADLVRRGVLPQARLDQIRAAYDTAANEWKAAQAERAVVERQGEEGGVLAPAAGRVLRVPVTVGSVVLPGESIATVAANQYLLRLELPERHAPFIKAGDAIKVGARGLGADRQVIGAGRIVQVYPELQSGRVVADAEAELLARWRAPANQRQDREHQRGDREATEHQRLRRHGAHAVADGHECAAPQQRGHNHRGECSAFARARVRGHAPALARNPAQRHTARTARCEPPTTAVADRLTRGRAAACACVAPPARACA